MKKVHYSPTPPPHEKNCASSKPSPIRRGLFASGAAFMFYAGLACAAEDISRREFITTALFISTAVFLLSLRTQLRIRLRSARKKKIRAAVSMNLVNFQTANKA